MLSTMLFVIFKITRKIKELCHRCSWRVKIIYYYYISRRRFIVNATVKAGNRFSIQSDLSATSILINEGARFRDNFHITMGQQGRLVIGSNCFFNNNCSISCLNAIEIGADTQFGENVLLYDHNHNYHDSDTLISAQGYSKGSILIGKNCWIGSNVVILKDVTIGDNTVIGAGCTIYKSIDANSVVINNQQLIVKPLDRQ